MSAELIAPEKSAAGQRVDLMQYLLGKQPQVECALTHRFTPGMYIREILMPAGSIVIGRIHKTTHPFVMLTGRSSTWTEEGGVVEMVAPCVGITTPGTRRVSIILEDCRFLTFHPTAETDLDKLQAELTDTPDVSYVEGVLDKLVEENFA